MRKVIFLKIFVRKSKPSQKESQKKQKNPKKIKEFLFAFAKFPG